MVEWEGRAGGRERRLFEFMAKIVQYYLNRTQNSSFISSFSKS